MKRLISELQRQESQEFNDRVANLFEMVDGAVVRKRVTKVGGLRISRNQQEPLGDIDVLVADRARRRLLSVETKDLAVARTPSELANEMKSTFAVGGSITSAADRHLERTAWLRQHMETVLAWLGLEDDAGPWSVDHLIVVNQELFS